MRVGQKAVPGDVESVEAEHGDVLPGGRPFGRRLGREPAHGQTRGEVGGDRREQGGDRAGEAAAVGGAQGRLLRRVGTRSRAPGGETVVTARRPGPDQRTDDHAIEFPDDKQERLPVNSRHFQLA